MMNRISKFILTVLTIAITNSSTHLDAMKYDPIDALTQLVGNLHIAEEPNALEMCWLIQCAFGEQLGDVPQEIFAHNIVPLYWRLYVDQCADQYAAQINDIAANCGYPETLVNALGR